MKQGVTKDIELKGICRAMSRGTGIDGVTDDLVNMRKENGSWKPMSDLTPVYPTDGSTLPYSRLWVHVGPDYRHVFGVLNGELYWFANIDENGAWQPVKEVKLCSIDAEALCHSNGNLVTVGGNTFLLYEKSKNNYSEIDNNSNGKESDLEVGPDGQVDFRVVQDKTTINNNEYINAIYFHTRIESEVGFTKTQLLQITGEELLTELSAAYMTFERGHRISNSFYAPFLVCAAYKTFSGDYVLAGRPMLMNPQSLFSYSSSINVSRLSNISLLNTNNGEYVIPNGSKTVFNTHWYYRNVEVLDTEITSDTLALSSCSVRSKNSGGLMDVTGHYSGTSVTSFLVNQSYLPTVSAYYNGTSNRENLFMLGSKTKLQVKAKPIRNGNNTVYKKLCVFVTPCVRDYDISGFNSFGNSAVAGEIPKSGAIHATKRDPAEIKKELIRNNFYKISEIDTSTLKGEWIDVEIDKGVLLNIVQQDVLPADTTSRNCTDARGSYSYNGRLHLFDYDSTLFHGWPLNYFFENPVEGNLPVRSAYDNIYNQIDWREQWLNVWDFEKRNRVPAWYVEVLIETYDGISNVVRYAPLEDRTDMLTEMPFGNGAFAREIRSLNPCISYPDTRAKKMTIYIKTSTASSPTNKTTYAKLSEFNLEPHARLNMAVYIDPELKPIDSVIPTVLDTQVVTVLPTELNATTIYENGLKVSAVDNPLYFPAELTYRVGNRRIVGMCANEVPVGVGQTGDAPLMVFGEDGVYGLFVDSSGELAYKYSRPISSDVCNNAKTIQRVDGGIVFATDRGLMMLKGATATDIGEIAEGDFLDITDTNGMFKFGRCALGAFTAQRICGFVNQQVTGEDFLRYLENAEVGYDHKGKELWAVNAQKDYCYVKDYDGNWRRVTEGISEVVACYPETYVVKNGGVYTLDEAKNKLLASPRRVFVMTRPIEVRSLAPRVRDSQNMKESYRVVARGEFKTDLNTLFGIYVLGSFDGRKWAVIGGRERQGSFTDIGCLTERYDIRYLLVVLAGDIGATGKIDGISVEVRQR